MSYMFLYKFISTIFRSLLLNVFIVAGVFKSTFKSLENVTPEVLYPIPDFTAFNQPVDEPTDDLLPKKKKPVFLSINRYERKKNLELSLKALGKTQNNYIHVPVVLHCKSLLDKFCFLSQNRHQFTPIL